MIWFLYLPLDIVTTLLAFPLAPLIGLFADGKGGVTLNRHNPLRLWLTLDNPIEGDEGHVRRWSAFVEKYPRFGLYVQRVFWLWRNKAYGWSWYVMNAHVAKDAPVWQWGDPRTGDDPYYTGWWIGTTSMNPLTARWMVYAVCPTFPGKCLRLYLGWKLRECLENRLKHQTDPTEPLKDVSAMYVCSFNPWKSREG